MRRIRYQVACSLDGYIAGPKDEIDWIVMDPEIDFGAIMAQFDTLLMGRRTYETLPGGAGGFGRMRILVFSRTLRPEEHPGVTIVSDDIVPTLERLRAEPGRDIWLFGGGALFRTLYALDQVDTIEPAVVPVVLGGGLPMLPTPADRKRLQLTNHRVYASSGIVLLEYAVERGAEGD
ncbi:MAG TPA: dihydrofolate reductase family protein [Longimicrobiales bacterium]|nr:dihydrofolate reductase family protein [Longimicrobiales bacterium]